MTSLVELRILEGPNLYFPRAAVKLTLDVSVIVEASDETALRFARRFHAAQVALDLEIVHGDSLRRSW